MPKNMFRIILGEEVQKSEYTEKRDCYQKLASYMSENSSFSGKVCALYGLRRTGKTVMMMQCISNMNEEEKKKTAYILCAENTDMLDLEECLDGLIADGRSNFFLDEITMVENFQARANVLSDYYAIGNRKIVIAGTDSLGIRLAMADKLYDRTITIHTSHVPYAEYNRLLKGKTFDEYIEYGGTLTNTTYKDNQSREEYVNSCIVNNILHSLTYGGEDRRRWGSLANLYSPEEISSVINKLINKFSYELVLRAISKKYKSAPLYATVQTKSMRHYREVLHTNEVNERTKAALGILDLEEMKTPIQEAHINELKRYLKELDLFVAIPSYLSLKRGIRLSDLEIFLQPGMIYAHAEVLLKQLADNEVWREECSMEERQVFLNRADEFVKGEIMENILISETFRAIGGDRFYVSQLSVSELSGDMGYSGKAAEADMIIADTEENRCYLFEVKHSSQIVPEQMKHLQNEEFVRFATENFGEVTNTCVIYNGTPQIPDDNPTIQYLNAEKFLNSIHEMSRLEEKEICIEDLFQLPTEMQPFEIAEKKPLNDSMTKSKPIDDN